MYLDIILYRIKNTEEEEESHCIYNIVNICFWMLSFKGGAVGAGFAVGSLPGEVQGSLMAVLREQYAMAGIKPG